MTWLRLDDKWNRHPKVVGLPRDARLFLVDCWTHCSDQLTDGFVGRQMLTIVSPGESLRRINGWVKCLETRGLLHPCSEKDGWECHDFLDWNPSKDEVEKTRERSRARARKSRETHETEPGVTAHVPRTFGVSNAEVTEHACAVTTHAVTPPRPIPSDPCSDPTDQVDAVAPPLALVPPEPEPPKATRPRQAKLPVARVPASVGWAVWRELYSTSRRNYGEYADAPEDGKVMGRLVAHAAEKASKQLQGLGMGAADPEPVVRKILRHWMVGFLRDEGRNGFLADNRHPLRCLPDGIPTYGMPTHSDERPAPVVPQPAPIHEPAPSKPPAGFDATMSQMFATPGGVN